MNRNSPKLNYLIPSCFNISYCIQTVYFLELILHSRFQYYS